MNAGETIGQFCKSERCKLFHTKPESIPHEFVALVSIATELREEALGKILSRRKRLEAWERDAYLTAERARRIVLAEIDDDTSDKEGESRVEATMKGDSGAFAFSNASTEEERHE